MAWTVMRIRNIHPIQNSIPNDAVAKRWFIWAMMTL